MSKLAEDVACAVAGITLGILVCFAIIGVCTVTLGPKVMCAIGTQAAKDTHP